MPHFTIIFTLYNYNLNILSEKHLQHIMHAIKHTHTYTCSRVHLLVRDNERTCIGGCNKLAVTTINSQHEANENRHAAHDTNHQKNPYTDRKTIWQCTVIHWVLGQQQFYLTREQICCGFVQQIRSRVKYAVVREPSLSLFCCLPSSFQKFTFSLLPLTNTLDVFNILKPSSPRIWTTPRHCDVKITWFIEPMKY